MTGKNEIDIIILGSFLQGPAHGYQLRQRIDMSFGQFNLKISTGSLYTRLTLFEKSGYIEGRREQQEKLPDRTVYQLTDGGRKRLIEMIATPIKSSGINWPELQHLLVHAIFFSFISREERIRVVQPFIDANRKQLEAGKKALKNYGSHMDLFSLISMEWSLNMALENHRFFESILKAD